MDWGKAFKYAAIINGVGVVAGLVLIETAGKKLDDKQKNLARMALLQNAAVGTVVGAVSLKVFA